MATIKIYRNGIWGGTGKLVAGTIEDCWAVLGADQDASDEAYEAIEAAIAAGGESVSRPDGKYTWDIE
jgi:hypothetical protein